MTTSRVLAVALLFVTLSACANGADEPGKPTSVYPAPTATPSPSSPAQEPSVSSTNPTPAENDDADQVGFLAALHSSGIPVSESGEGEQRVGEGVCQQLAAGADPGQLAKDLTAVGYSLEQAKTVVAAARTYLCP